ncbi:MAG: hypothetical protein F6J93_22905 [Oscillatoria sp. SIO1A7]|nr:hypothetical protein [Oscillatoria sp. SIO1A7]
MAAYIPEREWGTVGRLWGECGESVGRGQFYLILPTLPTPPPLPTFQGYVFYSFLAGARSVGCMGFWGEAFQSNNFIYSKSYLGNAVAPTGKATVKIVCKCSKCRLGFTPFNPTIPIVAPLFRSRAAPYNFKPDRPLRPVSIHNNAKSKKHTRRLPLPTPFQGYVF